MFLITLTSSFITLQITECNIASLLYLLKRKLKMVFTNLLVKKMSTAELLISLQLRFTFFYSADAILTKKVAWYYLKVSRRIQFILFWRHELKFTKATVYRRFCIQNQKLQLSPPLKYKSTFFEKEHQVKHTLNHSSGLIDQS